MKLYSLNEIIWLNIFAWQKFLFVFFSAPQLQQMRSFLFQQVTYLGKKNLLLGRNCRGLLLFPLEGVDHLYEEENGKGDDEEIDDRLDKLAIVEGNCRSLSCGSLQDNRQVTEVDAAKYKTYRGMMTSATTDETIFPKAAPMIMPTAISTTFPLTANSLNSLSIPMMFIPLAYKFLKGVIRSCIPVICRQARPECLQQSAQPRIARAAELPIRLQTRQPLCFWPDSPMYWSPVC